MKITYMKPLDHIYPSFSKRKRKKRLQKNFFIKRGIGTTVLIFYIPLIISIFQRDPLSLKSMIFLSRTGLYFGFMVALSCLPRILGIASSDNGIELTMSDRKIEVPWEDVIAIKPVYFMWFYKTSDIVQVRTSSLFDRIFLMHSSSRFKPCFHVSKWMINYDALLNRVRYHIRQNESSG